MKEIAKSAGTSQATVSRVLNGNMSVNPEVRNAVMESARKFNYQPNMLAKSLTDNKSLLLGVIIPDITNPFFSELMLNIEAEATKYGYSTILCNTSGDLVKEKYYMNIMSRYKADGIIMVPRNTSDNFFLRLKDHEVPIVISTLLVDGFNCVAISHFNAGYDVARHLIENGFESFAFVGSPGDEKEAGFTASLHEAGFDLARDYQFIDITMKGTMGEKLMPLLSDPKKRKNCGIFVLNDVTSLIVLDALKESNVIVPDEMGLIGFDNTFIGRQVSPSFSSVSQPIEDIGKLSVEMLLDEIMRQREGEPKKILLESKIIVRSSTKRLM